jgi:hypothetical protein
MSYGFYQADRIAIPHPPIPLAMCLIVEEAMRVAWERLKNQKSPKIDLLTADEDAVTHELYEILFDEVYGEGLVDGFDEERFTVVTREAKVRNFDGMKLDKMPDLLVGIAGRNDIYRRSQDWLFVECKPIDASHTVGVHYGAKGIARFIRGEYAWALPNALMVGYASAGYSLDPKLSEGLRSRAKEFEVIDLPKVCPKSKATGSSALVHVSQHGRTFNYRETGKAAPPILLRHLWLQRN